MIPQFTEEEYQLAKHADMLPLTCKECGATFYNPKSTIAGHRRAKSSNRGAFCGMQCATVVHRKKRAPVASMIPLFSLSELDAAEWSVRFPLRCNQCNSVFMRTKKHIKNALNPSNGTTGAFCTQRCNHEYLKLNHTYMRTTSTRNKARECKHCGKPFTLQANRMDINSDLCGLDCIKAVRHELRIQDFFAGKIIDPATLKRLMLELGIPYECDVCGTSEWMGKALSLHLDHINGRATNNTPENLRFLCPNCDSQSPFYMSKNKGHGRKSLGMKSS